MARSITTAAVGRANHRFIFLALVLGLLSAVLVYAAISRSDGGGGTTAGDVPVLVAKVAIPAGTRITASMVEVRQLPEGAVGDQALSSADVAIGKVARYPIAPNEQLLLSKVVGTLETADSVALSHLLGEGKRALAIGTSSVIGAGGLVLPGDHVDVLWVPDLVLTDHDGAMLLAENVEVVAVKQTLVDLPPTAPGAQQEGEPAPSAGDERVRGSEAEPIPDATTVTLLVTPDQARTIFCAEASGTLRLAVRAFGDETSSGAPPATCLLLHEEEG